MTILIFSEEPDFKPIVLKTHLKRKKHLVHIKDAPEFLYDWIYCKRKSKRWPEAEPIIMQDPEYACFYANEVIQGRWPEAEPHIRQDPELWEEYCDYFNIQ